MDRLENAVMLIEKLTSTKLISATTSYRFC